MENIARAIAGAAILMAGVAFTIFGGLHGFDGLPGFMVGMFGFALDILALFILLRIPGSPSSGARKP